MKKVTKELKFKMDITPVEDEDDNMVNDKPMDDKTQVTQEMEDQNVDMSSIATALQNINDAVANLDARLNNIEGASKPDMEIGEEGCAIDKTQKTEEELKGIPERPQGKKDEKPVGANEETPSADKANPIPLDKTAQPANGDSPNYSADNDVDDTKMGEQPAADAVAKVPKPASEYEKPKVDKNALDIEDEDEEGKKKDVKEDAPGVVTAGTKDDPTEPQAGATQEQPDAMKMHEQFIDNELKALKEKMAQLENIKFQGGSEIKRFEESFENAESLTTRQSVTGSVRSNPEKEAAQVAAQAEANRVAENYESQTQGAMGIIREYLSKPGVTTPATRRNFGMR